MNLYFIHCGFYDEEISEGIYEFHVNIPIAAESPEAAKVQVRKEGIFQKKKMHIDGIQEVRAASGFAVRLEAAATGGKPATTAHLHRDF